MRDESVDFLARFLICQAIFLTKVNNTKQSFGVMFDFTNLILQEFIRTFNREKVCLSYLEKIFWNNIPVSPFEQSSKIYNYSYHKYRCKSTGKNFNVRTNTLFHETKVPLDKWFYTIWRIANSTNGISSVQLSKEIGIRQATACSMLHRIRECITSENHAKKGGRSHPFVSLL